MTPRDRYLAAVGLSAAVFLLYLATLAPTTAMWDAGEYIAAAKSLGIPHQPGNPLFVLVAHVAGLLPLSPDYAVRINLLAAFSSAVTAGLWFLCAERLLRSTVEHSAIRLGASAVAAMLGATAFTVWNQSVVMEKVYPLALVGLALTSWLLLVWLDTPHGHKADRLLVLIAYLIGLGYAVHPAGLLTAPAVALAALRHRPKLLLRWKLLGVAAVAMFVGMTPFAVLPIRAAYQPFINESAVSACEDGVLKASCTFSAETARRLVGTIQREQYGGNPVAIRRAPLEAQFSMYWMYFRWQWLRDADTRMPAAQSLVAAMMLVLGVAGLVSLARRSGPAPHLWYFSALTVTFTIALVYYLNFRYGWSQSPELRDVEREPRDRDYFFMWTFSLWGLLAGLGFAWLAFGSRLSAFERPRGGATRPRLGVGTGPRAAFLLLAFALVLVPLAGNWRDASRKGQSFSSEWAKDVLNSIEPNGVIITNGDNDSFPLWYAQAVEGVRRDVTVTLTPYLDMEWYVRQLNRRANLWKLSDQELDTIPPYVEMQLPQRFDHPTIAAIIEPGYLTRGQLLVLRAIKDSFPDRPVYFSVGNYAQRLGLQPYLKRVGLVEKLEAQPVRESPDTVRLPTGFVDVPRSLELWNSYGGARQLVREGRWVDQASAGIPIYYAVVGQDLALALDARGKRSQALEVMDLARKVAEVVR